MTIEEVKIALLRTGLLGFPIDNTHVFLKGKKGKFSFIDLSDPDETAPLGSTLSKRRLRTAMTARPSPKGSQYGRSSR